MRRLAVVVVTAVIVGIFHLACGVSEGMLAGLRVVQQREGWRSFSVGRQIKQGDAGMTVVLVSLKILVKETLKSQFASRRVRTARVWSEAVAKKIEVAFSAFAARRILPFVPVANRCALKVSQAAHRGCVG